MVVEKDGQEIELELVFSQRRIEIIETKIGKSVMEIFNKAQALMTISDLKSFVIYGLKEVGKNEYINPTKATSLAYDLLENIGYSSLLTEVITALERDCGFLFRGA